MHKFFTPRIKKRRLRPAGIILSILVLLGSSSTYAYFALNKSLAAVQPAILAAPSVAAQTVSLPWPAKGQAAIGAVGYGVLAKSAPVEKAVPIASVAKVVTALAVMRQKPFKAGEQGAALTLDAVDVSYYNNYAAIDGSVTKVTEGERISEYQALQALLLPSANNMADSLVRWAFGSMDAYTAYANTMAREFGLTSTIISDASGFSDATISTPSDLIVIGEKALADPVISSIVAQAQANIPVAGTIINVNALLAGRNVIGIKTGNTDQAGGCLLFAATHAVDAAHSVTIIGAVLGTSSLSTVFPASQALLGASYSGFTAVEAVKRGAVLGSYSTPWGSKTDIIAKDTLTAYVWKGVKLEPKVSIISVDAPVKAGQAVGRVSLVLNGKTTAVEAVTKEALTPAPAVWRLTHF